MFIDKFRVIGFVWKKYNKILDKLRGGCMIVFKI